MASDKILYTPKKLLSPSQIIRLANRMLFNINGTLVSHNERTTFLSLELARIHPMQDSRCSIQNLGMLALFHTIGFFHIDFFYASNPHDSSIDFFSDQKETESKYMYSCYYLEYMTPLKKDTIALEMFNQDFDPAMKKYIYQTEYKSILYLSAQISDFIAKNPEKPLPDDLNELAPGKFDPDYVEAFSKANKGNRLLKMIKDNSYKTVITDFMDSIRLSPEETGQILKLLVYFIDFKSTLTVKHIIHTTAYAVSLGKRQNFSQEDMDVVFISALVHDIGKMASPQRILEAPKRLSPEEMGIMRHHVNHTKRILEGVVDTEILEAAYRHHEKLNGSGYPRHLTAKELTKLQRTITVADITSALTDSRSYKDEYTQEETVAILQQMVADGELDGEIVNLVVRDFTEIQEERKSLSKLLSVNFRQRSRVFRL